MPTHQEQRDRRELTATVARQMAEIERKEREAKTARLREKRMSSIAPADKPTSTKTSGKS
jgi:hypothetical protein